VDDYQQKLEANKKLVSEFYQAFFGDKDSTSIDKYVGDNIIQHSPLFNDGKTAFKDALRPFYSNPNITKKTVDIKHIAAEGIRYG
jgi:predicted SnoaL-like aldol condensation-catalyzing enzyme